MFLSSLLIAASLLAVETPDTLQAVNIVADKGFVVSRTDTVSVENNYSTLTEALLRLPGVALSDFGGLSGLKSASLRGLGSAHTEIYLDGVRVSNFQSGQNDLGMLPLETLGSAVVDYAQNSLSFRTARPVFGTRPVAGNLRLQAGSFGTWLPVARIDVRAADRVSLSAHAAGVLTRGDFPLADGSTRRTGNDLKQMRAGIDVFGLLTGGEWQAKAYCNASDRGTPGSLSWPSEDRQQDRNAILQGSLRKAFSKRYTLHVSAKGAYDRIGYQSAWGDSDYAFRDLQFNSSHNYHLTEHWGLSLATDLERGALHASDYDAARTAVIAALGGAFRAERFRADLALEYRGAFDRGIPSLHSVSPSINLCFVISEGLELAGFARRAFRAPTFNELYYPGYGNPDLKPEDAWLTDIGFAWNRSLGGFWHLDTKANLFYNVLTDKIISAPSEADPYQWLPYNVGRVEAAGADALAALRYDNDVLEGSFSARYAWQSALDKTPGSTTFDSQIPYVARHTVTLTATAGMHGWHAEALWNRRGGRADAAGEMPAWHTLDLALRKAFSLRGDFVLTLSASVRNLTDCRYEIVRDYPMPGRSVLGGLAFQF